jgi:hypothetical protein
MRKHIHVLPHRDVVPMESHSDGQRAGYFTRTLQTLLLALGYSEPPLFIGTPSLLHENSYLWRVCVIIYERPMTNCICCIYQVVEASTPRWTFERGMREPAREALAVLRHEVNEQMEHLQYCHFPSRAQDQVEAMVVQAGDCDHIGASPTK